MIRNPWLNNFGQFMQNFNQFAQQFNQQKTDPRQRVQELLNSGQMSQQEFEELRTIANQITGRQN